MSDIQGFQLLIVVIMCVFSAIGLIGYRKKNR